LNLAIEQDDDELVPPSRESHKKRFGQQLLGDFDEDKDEYVNDEEAPKPTQDVLMSRNLKGAANKGFNFADSNDSDSDDGPAAQV